MYNCTMNFQDYDISEKYGFLMQNPLDKLPCEFDLWNDLAENAPRWTINKEFRKKVDTLPLLDHSKLKNHREKRLAHLQLSIITMCYVWQEGRKDVAKALPRNVAIPFYAISDDLGIQPITSYVCMVMANWKLKDEDGPCTLSNLTTLYQCIPGEEEAVWFIINHVQIELDFVPAIKALVEAMRAAEVMDNQLFISSCTCIRNCFMRMKDTLSKMHEKLSAEAFYHTIRTFLHGYGGEKTPLPDGLLYEGVSKTPKKLIGGSGAQSPTLQCFDMAFGVEHQEDVTIFLEKMRMYMSHGHRKFIEDVIQKSTIRKYVLDSKDDAVVKAYNSCILAAADFRTYHIQIITKYIIIMSRQPRNDNGSNHSTGRTSVVPFLKSMRNATLNKLVPVV